MRLQENPQLPMNPDTTYAKDLNFTLTKVFRDIAQKVNGVADGRVTAIDNAQTSVPTTGQWRQGDFVRNSTPSVITSTPNYVVLGWECIASGEPGTWVAVTTPETQTSSAWANVALTPSAATGTFGSASAQGWFNKVGRNVSFTLEVTITTNGTAAGAVRVTLPYTAARNTVFCGRDNVVTGNMLQGFVFASGTFMSIWTYANAYPGVNGCVLTMTGVYEATT